MPDLDPGWISHHFTRTCSCAPQAATIARGVGLNLLEEFWFSHTDAEELLTPSPNTTLVHRLASWTAHRTFTTRHRDALAYLQSGYGFRPQRILSVDAALYTYKSPGHTPRLAPGGRGAPRPSPRQCEPALLVSLGILSCSTRPSSAISRRIVSIPDSRSTFRPAQRAQLPAPSAGGHEQPDKRAPVRVPPRLVEDRCRIGGRRRLRVRRGFVGGEANSTRLTETHRHRTPRE